MQCMGWKRFKSLLLPCWDHIRRNILVRMRAQAFSWEEDNPICTPALNMRGLPRKKNPKKSEHKCLDVTGREKKSHSGNKINFLL